jgi:hypothetical protein
MNRLLFAALLFVLALFLVLAVKAQPSPTGPYSVTLAWDKSAGTNVIVNYAVWWGITPGGYTNSLLTGTNLTGTVPGLLRGPVYFFAATATDNNGLTSAYSTEVSTNQPAPPNRPGNTRITAVGP